MTKQPPTDEDDAAFRSTVREGIAQLDRSESVPHAQVMGELREILDQSLRYRFERGMEAEARGEAFEISPRELMARIRARVGKSV
ncbi:MAG: hypothetical protein QM756_16490 [Polyangiaceae bacterium]